MPTFDHRFTAANGTVSNGSVTLSVREIEDVGVLEVLQTPGAALGTWQFLGALLDPTVPSFSFRDPLGHAREVKTAVSGLFGRFVARAYATRFIGLTHFAHVRKPPMRLGGVMRGELRRVAGRRGDMPDWVAWGAAAGMAIVEAKGCHDAKSPQAALDRAYAQAGRAEIVVRGRRAPFKRYAIATRWGFSNPKVSTPMLWVEDPDEEGDISDAERQGLEIAMSRWHAATLLAPLGLTTLAKSLIDLTRAPFHKQLERAKTDANDALSTLTPVRAEGDGALPEQLLIGGYVTRAGPMADAIADIDVALLQRLDLRPTFVGLELAELKRAIEGIPPPAIGVDVSPNQALPLREGEAGAGSWVIRLEGKKRIVPQDRGHTEE